MPTSFAAFDFDTFEDIIRAETPADLKENEAFYDGDHWQGADGWFGPIPDKSAAGYKETKAKIKDAFESKNVIKEVTDRLVEGVLGSSPEWGPALREEEDEDEGPSDQQQALIEEARRLIQSWWDDRELHDQLIDALTKAAYGHRSVLRLYVPKGKTNTDPESGARSVPSGTLEETLDLIHVDVVAAGQATVWEHPHTKDEIGIYSFQRETDIDEENGEEVFEVTYVNERGQTVIRQVTETSDTGESFAFDLGGMLTMHEIDIDALITAQVRQNQKSLNMTKTLMSRNEVNAGFLQMLLLNAQEPGEWEGEGPNKTFKPKPMPVGPGKINFVSGQVLAENNEGEAVEVADPKVVFREPSDVEVFVESKRSKRADILDEVGQSFILMSSDSTASGRSRIVARHEFKKTLDRRAPAVASAGRGVLEAALSMAAAFAGQVGRYDPLRISFDPVIDTGPLSAEERKAIREDVSAGLLSLETALSQLGVADVEAEKERLMTATSKAEEVFQVVRASGLKSPRLNQLLFERVILEQFPDVDEEVITEIQEEIEDATRRQSRRQAQLEAAQNQITGGDGLNL